MPKTLTEEDFSGESGEDTPSIEPSDVGSETDTDEGQHLEGGPGKGLSFDEKGNAIEVETEEEEEGEEDKTPPSKSRFKSHEEAEDGYRNLQSEHTKAKNEIDTLKKVLAKLGDRPAVPTQTPPAGPPQDPYLEMSKALVKELNAIDDNDPEAAEKVTSVWMRHFDQLASSRAQETQSQQIRMDSLRKETEKRAVDEGGISPDDIDLFWAAVQLTPTGLNNDQVFQAAIKMVHDISGRFESRFSNNQKTLKENQKQTSSLQKGGTRVVSKRKEDEEDYQPQTLISQIQKAKRIIK